MSVSRPDDSGSLARPVFHQRKSFKIVVVLALYVGSYAILSLNGRYIGRPSGEHRYDYGLAITDLSLWSPAGLCWERRKSVSGEYIFEANPLGWFYLPLIAIDRKWVHPTGDYFDPQND